MRVSSSFLSLAVIASLTALTAFGQPVRIDSLGANGQLTVKAPVGSDFSVEWSPSLGTGVAWSPFWENSLTFIHSTNATMQVPVPMFYRVSCYTNGLLWLMKPGASYAFAVSNALHETAIQRIKLLGRCYVPEYTNYYGVLNQEEAMVTGGVSGGTVLMRSDGFSVWVMADPQNHMESQEFFRGTVGAVITNAANVRVQITAIENVTVPAGTFTNCIKFHKTDLWSGNPNPTHDEWLAPGLGMVKWVDYDVSMGSAVPVVYLLQSATGF